MREKIIATDKDRLAYHIKYEIKTYGYQCDLNHIDVSEITDMSRLFERSEFNGDISKWDVSKVKNMYCIFYKSKFKCDISLWRPLKIESTKDVFLDCRISLPYWFGSNNNEVVKNIELRDLFNKLNSGLINNDNTMKKIKI